MHAEPRSPAARRPGTKAATAAASPGPPTTAAPGRPVGLPVADILGLHPLRDARLVAGEAGTGRVVQRLNVLEGPDILPWIRPRQLLLTTGLPLRQSPRPVPLLLGDLDRRGVSALGVRIGRHRDVLTPEVLRRADALGLPVLLLPEDLGFDEILGHVLAEILNRQAAVLARAEETHRGLLQIVLGGGGLGELTTQVSAVLGVAVAAIDTDGRTLAGAGPPEQLAAMRPPPGRDGRALPAAPYVTVPVSADGVRFGRLVAYDHGTRLGDGDVAILDRAAIVAALILTKQAAVAEVEGRYRSDFLRDVLAGRAGSPGRVITHGASFGWRLDRPAVVIVSELDPVPCPDGGPAERMAAGAAAERVAAGDPERRRLQDRLAAAWMAALRRQDQGAAVAALAHEVVAVVGAEEIDTVPTLVKDVTAAMDGPRGFTTGVSRAVSGPGGLPAGYDQARKAVRVGRQLHGPGALAHFDKLGVYRLLSQVPDTEELHAFVQEVLGPLAADDDAEHVDLRHTLQVLLETNLNVAETARRLHFHYNTLRYRIGKLERLLGPFTDDAHLRLNLTLALHVLKMRGI
ncbi:MAG: PucR family transcriptional regulator [Streptosporangiales bacterium]|nr:PucR family transcriptional regulator [Streptosporangiales bacterium]